MNKQYHMRVLNRKQLAGIQNLLGVNFLDIYYQGIKGLMFVGGRVYFWNKNWKPAAHSIELAYDDLMDQELVSEVRKAMGEDG